MDYLAWCVRKEKEMECDLFKYVSKGKGAPLQRGKTEDINIEPEL